MSDDEDTKAMLREIRDSMLRNESRYVKYLEESRVWIEESRRNHQQDIRRRKIIGLAVLGGIFLVVVGIALIVLPSILQRR